MKTLIHIKNNRKTGEIEVSFSKTEKLSISNSGEIRNQILNILSKPGTQLTINMKGVRYIDSSGLSLLSYLGRMAKIRKSGIRLSNINPTILELIDLVKENSVFEIESTTGNNGHRKVA